MKKVFGIVVMSSFVLFSCGQTSYKSVGVVLGDSLSVDTPLVKVDTVVSDSVVLKDTTQVQ